MQFYSDWKSEKNDNLAVYTLYSTQKATERVQALIKGDNNIS